MLLTPLSLYIMLALAQSEKIATEIVRQIAMDSQSTLLPGDSAFYKALRAAGARGVD